MMNLSFLSPKTIAHIARGAVSLEQNYYYHSHGWSNHYSVRVAYPNGYGASIVFVPNGWDDEEVWEVGLLEDDEDPWGDDDEEEEPVWSNLTEAEVIEICDRIYFY